MTRIATRAGTATRGREALPCELSCLSLAGPTHYPTQEEDLDMPKMSKRWRNVAIATAILGFAAFAIQLGVHPSVFVPGDTSCPAAALNGGCFQAVPVNPGSTILLGVLNAVVWYGLVYLMFLAFRTLRRIARR